MSRLRDVRRAMALVDACPIIADLEGELEVRFPSERRCGRPRAVTVRALLVALVAVGLDDRKPRVTALHKEMLSWGPSVQQQLGLPRLRDVMARKDAPTVPAVVSYHQVDYLFCQLGEILDDNPTRAGRRLSKDPATDPDRAAVEASTRRLAPEEAETRRQRRQRLLDELMAATIPDEFRTVGNYAIDWTDLEVWARSGYKHRHSADPGAAWGRRRPKRNRIAGRGKGPVGDPDPEGKNELFFGNNLHAAVLVADVGGPFVPQLAARIVLTPANDMAVGPLLVGMTDRLQADGRPTTEYILDRGYSMKSPDNLHRPLAARGVHLVYDLRVTDLGVRGTHHGALIMGGELYCPAMPEALRHHLPYPGMEAANDPDHPYWAERAKRDQWAFRRLGRATPDLKQRYEDPAAAERLRCELRPASQSIPYDRNVPEVFAAPNPAPDCCTRCTLPTTIDVGLGQRQRYPWGSKAWAIAYARRTAVERWFSYLKLGTNIDGFDIRLFGLAKRSLMIVAAAIAVNVRLVERYRATGGADSGPAVHGDRVVWHPAGGDRHPHQRRTTDPPVAA